MGTLVCFHAHPDDESISTGGSLARASAEGHRVVLVIATNGDYGESARGSRRGRVAGRPAPCGDRGVGRGLGRAPRRLARLQGQRDDRLGAEQRSRSRSCRRRSKRPPSGSPQILREENADVLTVYDWHGNYGHPDHIKVHTVGYRAAELAGTPTVFEATMNRDHIVRMMEAARAGRCADQRRGRLRSRTPGADDGNPLGMPEAEITHAVDVSAYVDAQSANRCAAHRSQVTDTGFFLTMPDEAFALGVRHRVVHPEGRRAGPAARDGCSNDPPVPRSPRPRRRRGGTPTPTRVSTRSASARPRRSPTGSRRSVRCRCYQPVAALPGDRRTRWPTTWNVEAQVEPAVAEIPSPEGVAMADRIEWLRVAMRGTWSDLGRSLRRLPRPGGQHAGGASRATRSSSAISSPSTPRSGLRPATIGWSSAASTTAR